ncbi:hypothetical protein AKJ65_05790 [candidate division MSBL1 archaeon SCGC-AAA259E19]|uniref:Uncharacterized protein n=1 Tax=candidate division MSBL1 archaeon SCGC-AAA259E19 TaxID=1698264 RepID=A0A133UIC4_9EURY|nr:hypothetical protein AKJ65_05790 [candidate division MSBL1 archaeon SCGC-AAA259E19]
MSADESGGSKVATLRKVEIENFRSIGDESISLESDLTVLVGPNEGGKTNTLQAISKLDGGRDLENSDKKINSEIYESDEIPDLVYIFIMDRGTAEECLDNCEVVEDPVEIKLKREKRSAKVVEVSNVKPLPRFENPNSKKIKVPRKDGSQKETQSKGFTLTEEYNVSKFKERFKDDDKVNLIEDPEPDISYYKIEDYLPEVFYLRSEDMGSLKHTYPMDDFRRNPEDYQPLYNIFKLAGREDVKQVIRRDYEENYGDIKRSLEDIGDRATEELRKRWRQSEEISLVLDHDRKNIRVYVQEDGQSMEPGRRSEGFRWFLTFFINFASEMKGDTEGNLILLDEPGLVLHPKGQKDLTELISEIAESNQIVYATPSPFLIPKKETSKIRIVERNAGEDTQIRKTGKNDLRKDELVRSILGMDMLDSYLVSDRTIVVEGPTDEKILYTIAEKMMEEKSEVSEEIEFNPFRRSKTAIVNSGGAGKSSNIGKFLEKNGLNYVLLFDYEGGTRDIMEDYKNWAEKRGMSSQERNRRILPVNDEKVKEGAVTIEDLLPKDLFLESVNELLRKSDSPFELREVEGEGNWISQINGKLEKHSIPFRLEGERKFEVVQKVCERIESEKITKNGEVKDKFVPLVGLVNRLMEKLEDQNEKS